MASGKLIAASDTFSITMNGSSSWAYGYRVGKVCVLTWHYGGSSGLGTWTWYDLGKIDAGGPVPQQTITVATCNASEQYGGGAILSTNGTISWFNRDTGQQYLDGTFVYICA